MALLAGRLLATCALLFCACISTAAKVKGAIVVLTHGSFERIEKLDRAIQTLDDAFNRRLQYPIVVFTGVSFGEPKDWLPKQEWLDWLANRTTTRLIFAEVNFSDYINAPHSAQSPGHVEGYGRGYRDMCRFFGGMIMDHPVMQVNSSRSALTCFSCFWLLGMLCCM